MNPRIVPFLLLLLTGCSNVYYNAMEKVGFAKREILVDRVEDAQEAQQDAKEQFTSALDQLLEITRSDGGDLKTTYNRLNSELRRSETRAKEVRERIAAVEDVAEALFDEWEDELEQYESASLRRSSERQLRATRERYEKMIGLMQRAASRMDPVLATFRDQVLFLKHNLNARALAGLDVTAKELEADVGALLADMERSIREADAFVAELQRAE